MSDYPDPDEEFELMYGDELELLNEQDDLEAPPLFKPANVRKSLDFGDGKDLQEEKSNKNSEKDEFPALPMEELSTENSKENTKKRTIQELFKDMDDLLFNTQLQSDPKKSKKLDEDAAKLEMIEKILEMRRLANLTRNGGLKRCSQSNATISRERDKNNLSYRLPKFPFVPVKRGSDGERIYVRFHNEQYEKEYTEKMLGDLSYAGVLGEAFKDTWTEANDIINKEIDAENQSQTHDIIAQTSLDENTQLWVDLYKPRKYLELLSDEGTNRILLRWIKLWDKIVFNRRPKIKPAKAPDPKDKWSKYQRYELNTTLEDDNRPHDKIALLCGPPGLGKTTLAHMVAKHAGYNVVEINASDEKSLEAFQTLLENATQMRSVVDQQKRPNCIIFDEIDGAPASSIDFLVKFINGQVKTTQKSANKKGKHKEKTKVLKRPVICICNDVYVPALRTLRQHAFVVNFPQTSTVRLSERLMEIARRQQVKTDSGTMMALAEKSNNDIRSCLSILHFYKSLNKPVTLTDVYRSSIGQKDMQKGLFSVWNDIFHIVRPKGKNLTYDETLKFRMRKVLDTVTSFGDYDRVLQGVYENYPLIFGKNGGLRPTCDALEWFCFCDLINQQIYSGQNFSLTPYLQFAFVKWHFIFGSFTWPKVKYPSTGYEVKVKQDRQKSTIHELIKGIPLTTRSYINSTSLILDILPLLTRIICPIFRPVSLHLYTKEEKENMERVVNAMIDYNLTYVQEKNLNGSYDFKIDPNIDEFILFPKSTQIVRRKMPYNIKQIVAREVDTMKMKRMHCLKPVETPNRKKDGTNVSPSQFLPNHLQRLKAKSVKKVEPIVKDFFGRVIQKKASEEKNGPEIKNDIWYKYKEGYNNAVRKKVLISNLL